MVDLKAKPFYLTDAQIQWVEDTIAGMTLEEKLGQLFVILQAQPGFGEKQVAQWKWLQRDEQSEKADLVIFLVFLIPGTPKDMLTYVVGMTRVSLKRFLWLSTLARVPSVLSSTLIGSSVIQGEGETALILMLVTGLLGILGIEAREKILAFCRRVREKRKQD